MDFTSVVHQLQQKGYRHSKNRCKIVETFTSEMTPLTIQELLKILASQSISMNKTTAYREIDILMKEGFVQEISFGDSIKRYELTSHDHHHHLVCTKCNSIEEVVLDKDLEFAERYISLRKRFKVTNHNLEFFGICRSCQ